MPTGQLAPTSATRPLVRLRAARERRAAAARSMRAARIERTRLQEALRSYTTGTDRAEIGAILNRYPESETHRAWEAVLVEGTSAPAAHLAA